MRQDIVIAGYRFTPGLVPTLAVILLLPSLIALGVWQLNRAEQKRVLQEQYDARVVDVAVQIGGHIQKSEELQFYRVEVSGYYETDYAVYLDNRIHQGRAGYYVMSPLRIAGSQTRVLINRGWVPTGTDRRRLPGIKPPVGLQRIAGVATVPQEKVFRLAEPEPLEPDWQDVWQHLDLKRYAAAVPFPVQPVVVLLDPESEAGGFVREWKRLDAGIAVHQGYAFQWFSLAVVLATLFLFTNLRRSGPRKDSDSGLNTQQ